MSETNREGQLSTADVAYGRSDTQADTERTTETEGRIEGSDERRDSAAGDRIEGSDERRDSGTGATEAAGVPLLPETSVSSFREQWQAIQTRFVDEPQEAVREADSLVAEVIQTLAKSFADQREQLEGQWSRGSEVSTEDLRQALQQYRSFFQRLLAA